MYPGGIIVSDFPGHLQASDRRRQHAQNDSSPTARSEARSPVVIPALDFHSERSEESALCPRRPKADSSSLRFSE